MTEATKTPAFQQDRREAPAPVVRLLRHVPPQWWLCAMLLTLHYALVWDWDVTNALSRGLLLAHFGFFLIWQPLWHGERVIDGRHAVLLLLLALLFISWVNWWLLVIWIAVLFALIGGNASGARGTRRLASIVAGVYLLALLLIWVVPHNFRGYTFTPYIGMLVYYGLPLLPALILFLSGLRKRDPVLQAVDLFYSVLLFLFVAALVLCSFVIGELGQEDYGMALVQSLFVMAFLLLTLSWLWNPHGGFTGIGYLASRYLLGIGLPFERWVKSVADLAEYESEPETFLSLALYGMRAMPWISGTEWKNDYGTGISGEPSRFRVHIADTVQGTELTFYTRWTLSPALLLHLKLLTQVLGHFYAAKKREAAQRDNAYTQAIHETGARLTHDVKNLLQALHSLSAALEGEAGKNGDAHALMKKQLPLITQRLSVTLDKLKAPTQAVMPPSISAETWWRNLQQRYAHNEIEFTLDGALEGTTLPGELFDSVAENLLQNALFKKAQQPSVQVSVTFGVRDGEAGLLVRDTGAAVPAAIASRLLAAPVSSHHGLGVGLYQASKQAKRAGWELELVDNTDGRVEFGLRRPAAQ